MVQGGYVSPSSAKTLTVNKRTNVLNKIPPRGPKNSTNNNNNNNSSELCAGIDVSILLAMFCAIISFIFEFGFSLINNCFTHTQESQVKELMDELKKQSEEMRKLKAIIVKHENRIRGLEAAQKAREDDALDIILQNNEADSKRDSNLAPDEV